MKVNPTMCATCPWREDSPYRYLLEHLVERACAHESRICHSTGSNALFETDKPEALCRGARGEQLRYLASVGFLTAPTDDAWNAKCAELGLEPNRCSKRGSDPDAYIY